MPYANTPWVRDGALVDEQPNKVVIDTPAWFAWLDQTTSFCFSCPSHWIRLTVRREKRRGKFYWYAYTKVASKLHNKYVGKTPQVTQLRLQHVCDCLWQKQKDSRREVSLTTQK